MRDKDRDKCEGDTEREIERKREREREIQKKSTGWRNDIEKRNSYKLRELKKEIGKERTEMR